MWSCITCHTRADGRGGENDYGRDYGNNGHSFPAIEGRDSDNDGFTNIQGITAGYFPGNAGSKPPTTASPPLANAAPDQTRAEGVVVTLNGSNSSDPDNDIASYLWEQTTGSYVSLSNPSAVRPTFTTPNVGANGDALTFRLTVTDSGGLESTDTCISNVTWVNNPPTANAGYDQNVNEGTRVTLNGSDSFDPDDGIVSYLWEQTAGLPVVLNNTASASSWFTAPDILSGGISLTLQLTVTDGGGLRSTDTCVVNIGWTNQSPTADAGPDQNVGIGMSVTLDGSYSTDPDDGIVSYLWTQVAGLPVSLSDTRAVAPFFTSPDAGTGGTSLRFQLTVTDSGGLQSTDTCIVNVSWINLPPTADAGPDQTAMEGETVALNGSNSSDSETVITSFLWTQTGGPAVTLSDAASQQPTFVTPVVDAGGASLAFRLTVMGCRAVIRSLSG
jgi:hypothetical protein